MWKVRTEHLILIAAIVWGAAGLNILLIGLGEYGPYCTWVNSLLSAAVFAVFFYAIFRPLVRKHTTRILSYQQPTQYFWMFFDIRSFIIMVAMITIGILLRNSTYVPRVFIAVFYSGLGTALLTAGIMFAYNYIHVLRRQSTD